MTTRRGSCPSRRPGLRTVRDGRTWIIRGLIPKSEPVLGDRSAENRRDVRRRALFRVAKTPRRFWRIGGRYSRENRARIHSPKVSICFLAASESAGEGASAIIYLIIVPNSNVFQVRVSDYHEHDDAYSPDEPDLPLPLAAARLEIFGENAQAPAQTDPVGNLRISAECAREADAACRY